MEETRGLFCTCDSLSNTTPVSLLANEFDVRSILHGQVSFTAVNQSLPNRTMVRLNGPVVVLGHLNNR